ncbi:SDR family NAD(P)-dependent oxidoreductase [Croceicoccus marinus]|uniref:SDR family NAD(P)-dependent oxidoreductase n=1 Tax=Croceicoccus marinus TaxID=450378 RepID=UPI0008358A54|nr:SDR family NAD(P)-dependent oxidoreductase [Croceicoccus marinus]
MAADLDFSNRNALVTGAASGIGAATAHWLDRHGIARLVLVDRNADGLAALTLGCQVELLPGDVSDPDFWSGFGGRPAFDLLVVNAGIPDAVAAGFVMAKGRRRPPRPIPLSGLPHRARS